MSTSYGCTRSCSGSGKRLFSDGGPAATLRLADSRTTSGGLVILTYQAPER